MNWLDRAIEAVSPALAYRRERARTRIKAARLAQAYYDGATKKRRSASLRYRTANQNTVTRAENVRLRSAAHDLVRNNSYAAKAKMVITANIVGSGIVPHYFQGDEVRQDIKDLAKRHLESTDCDIEGRHNLFGLQRLACGTIVESGEVVIRKKRAPRSAGLAVPVQYQVLEPDFIDTNKDVRLKDGGRILQGVQFDANGRREGMWLFDEHPGDYTSFRSTQSRFVPASDVLHAFLTERPGQVRGVTWFAPVILDVADWKDFKSAQLIRQKIAACYAVFVTGGEGLGNVKAENDEVVDQLEPGLVHHLGDGEDVTFANPPTVSGYKESADVELHAIAAGMGITYEALTGDLKGVSFSGGRMGRNDMERNVDPWQGSTFIPQVCAPMQAWFLQAVAITGVATDDVSVVHAPPWKALIDPPREVGAQIDEVRAGFETLSDMCRRRGKDPRTHLKEIAEDLKLLDEL